MKLDQQLRDALTVEAQRVLKEIKREPASVVVARKIQGAGTIGRNILVITEDTVSWGWPVDGHLICSNKGH